jgi:activator of 2-hydroxyglutaryl-CoA dehydratase
MIPSHILGIDIGSVTVGAVAVSPRKKIVSEACAFHHGSIAGTLRHILSDFNLAAIVAVAATNSTPKILKTSKKYDNRVCIITACRHFHGKIGSILLVGGEKFGLIQFDDKGNYLHFKANTPCAAGTGSFLDQQAARLNLNGIQQLSEIAFNNTGVVPKIASRCAVFAKTDLVHAQQEGCTMAEICDGLCHGLAKNIVDTAFAGESPNDPIIFTGGVSRNRAVVQHIERLIGRKVIVEKTLYGAAGAALNLIEERAAGNRYAVSGRTLYASVDQLIIQRPVKRSYDHPPLELKHSSYPDFDSHAHYEFKSIDSENRYPVEVDIYETLAPGKLYPVALGIDVGSTSTKAGRILHPHSRKAGCGGAEPFRCRFRYDAKKREFPSGRRCRHNRIGTKICRENHRCRSHYR